MCMYYTCKSYCISTVIFAAFLLTLPSSVSPNLGREKLLCFSQVWSSLSAPELCSSVLSSSLLESLQFQRRNGLVGWILLTCCYPTLLIRTFVGWGWQGITKHLLSDKLNWGNHKQDVHKRATGTHWPIALNQLSVLEPAGKQGRNQELSLDKLSTTWVRSIILKGFGAIQVCWWEQGGRSVTHYGDWLTGNSPSWKQKFRERILNMFWEGSHSWNWFGRQMASRNANQNYIARCRWSIVSFPVTATW